MNIRKYYDLLEYIELRNSWKNSISVRNYPGRPRIKYIRNSVDTRRMKVFYIEFDKTAFRNVYPGNEAEFILDIYKYLNDKNYKSKYMVECKKEEDKL